MDAGEVGDVDPAEVRNIGDAVFVTDEVVTGGEAGVEDAVEALGFAYVALGRVGDTFFGEAVEAGRYGWCPAFYGETSSD